MVWTCAPAVYSRHVHQQGSGVAHRARGLRQRAIGAGIFGRLRHAVAFDILYVLDTLAVAQARNKRYTEAKQTWEEAIEINPEDPHIYASRAIYLYIETEEWEKANRDLNKALEIAPDQHGVLAEFGSLLLEKEEYQVAQPILQKCLEVREELIPDSWLRYNAMSMLGESLAGQGQYAEAEPLLLEGFAKMETVPESLAYRKTEALERIIKLYEAWDKADEAERWRKKQ